MPDTILVRPLNRLTGEIGDPIEGIPEDTSVPRRRNKTAATRYTTPYVMFFRPIIPILATMRRDDLNVLYAVIDQVDPKRPEFRIDIAAAVVLTGRTGGTIENSIRRLVHSHILLKPARATYTLNAYYLWCHGVESREAALTAWTTTPEGTA
jgi:hypothetical protein